MNNSNFVVVVLGRSTTHKRSNLPDRRDKREKHEFGASGSRAEAVVDARPNGEVHRGQAHTQSSRRCGVSEHVEWRSRTNRIRRQQQAHNHQSLVAKFSQCCRQDERDSHGQKA